MEDASVRFLLENLNRLRLHQADLISDVKDQMERLEKNLLLLKRFLNESTGKREILEEVTARIREVVYKAEDAVDVYVSQALEKETEKYFRRASDPPGKLLGVVEEVESTGARVKELYDDQRQIDISRSQTDSVSDSESTPTQLQKLEGNQVSFVRQDIVVGFEDEADKIIEYLNEDTGELDVLSIVGMPGLGKTTLARKIFRDPTIEYEFPIRLWVSVSQVYSARDIFLTMLRDLSWITEDMYGKTDEEIAQTLCARLEREKFLIILDDVWTTKAWDDLRDAFPSNKKANKILITTRMKNVAYHTNRFREPHMLRYLTSDESWKLIKLTVFDNPNCPRNWKSSEELLLICVVACRL
ncbi:UNVERIFIED_CONTAM: putative late blight resistance proteinR1A-10 [Sesamum angustifolium]|uniref:Late blight resistance proteinR1A-10 n=1 Tax=Sesamum angustifolium TaxID=2727405 RepID=A0AAW2IVR4_9LAMI